MGISTTKDQDRGIIIHKVDGSVTIAEILNAMNLTTRPEFYAKTTWTLWDFTEAALDIFDLKEAKEVSQSMQDLSDHFFDGAVAVAVRSKLEYGFARVITGFAGEMPYDIKISQDLQEALTWLLEHKAMAEKNTSS